MASRRVIMTRNIHAPISRVWDAWTNREQLGKWFSPEDMTATIVQFEPKPKGVYKVTMQAAKGEQYTAMGEYKEVLMYQRLEFTWQWLGDPHETLVVVDFQPLNEHYTQVTLTHSGFADQAGRKNHQQGWDSTFNHLEKLFTGQA